jgi:RimJ/RimL family protein N-acetyltransferase
MTTATLSAPEILTERLRLRRPQGADAPAIAKLANDFAVASMTTRMPYPYGVEDARAFVSLSQALDPRQQITFALEHRDAGFIGCLGFHRGAAAAPVELGYWLGRPYWGKGLATEATRAALKWATQDWGRRLVASGHFADNAASANVLIKAGFLYTGEVQKRFSRARYGDAATRMMVLIA